MGMGVGERGSVGSRGWGVDVDKDENRRGVLWDNWVVGGVVGVVYFVLFFYMAGRVLELFFFGGGGINVKKVQNDCFVLCIGRDEWKIFIILKKS